MDTLFLAYQKSGATDKAVALAQQVAATGTPSDDMLLVLTQDAVKRKDRDKVHAYCAKLVEAIGSKPKPEGVADADWTKRKNTILVFAYSVNGEQYFNEGKLSPADQELRKALPLAEDNLAVKAEVLFYLGLANYKMEKGQEAYSYFKACAAVKSPFQAQATKNMTVLRTQYHGIKMNLLVPNLGSTSLKYQILEMPSETVLARGRARSACGTMGKLLRQIGGGGVRVDAVVFKCRALSGPQYRGTFVIDDAVLQALEEFLPAAPAHNAIYLAAIRAFRESLPGIPLVAAFETEFHRPLCPVGRRDMAYLPIGARMASGSTDSTAHRTSTWPSARRRCWAARRGW